MATNLKIDPALLERARKIGKQRTKRDTVTEALEEYIRHREQMKVFDLAGQIDFDPAYDYKKQRRRA